MKYKVVTDNLDWLGLEKFAIITKDEKGRWLRSYSDALPNDSWSAIGVFAWWGVDECLLKHSDWFEMYGEPLLVTEDGVDIRYGDCFFWVDRDFMWHKECAGRFTESKSCPHAFSVLEKADQFIEENKPQYSKKDMIEFAISYHARKGHVREHLEEWFKNREKINNLMI